jgi:hypothetical protein
LRVTESPRIVSGSRAFWDDVYDALTTVSHKRVPVDESTAAAQTHRGAYEMEAVIFAVHRCEIERVLLAMSFTYEQIPMCCKAEIYTF